MKKKFIVSCIILIPFFIFGQKLFKNPVLNDNDKIGKIIKLKKFLTITDDSGDFHFIWYSHCETIDDGSIYIQDKKALYKFNKQGKYLGNLFKRGEGPGELDWLYNYFIDGDSIIMYSHFTSKVVKTDFNGKLKKEFRLPGGGMKLLMDVSGGRYFYRIISTREMDQKPKSRKGERILNYKYYCWDEKKSIINNNFIIFPEIQTIEIQKNGGILSGSKNRLRYSKPIDGIQFFSNSPDYKIIKVDLKNMNILKKFGRSYKRLRFYPEPLPPGVRMTPNLKKYFNTTHYKDDVLKLTHRGDRLWAITSTFVKGKGILVDVYDLNGVYINKLYIPLKEETSKWSLSFSIDGDRIISYDEDEDGNYIVIIYKMIL